eukprot:GHVU01004318.1.p1 GENE.GHVU01004318.1~~GHVU01004318.1.p1  ORF type:complete len:110 (-),score=3.23 GHVU01004318.1:186-515(-)
MPQRINAPSMHPRAPYRSLIHSIESDCVRACDLHARSSSSNAFDGRTRQTRQNENKEKNDEGNWRQRLLTVTHSLTHPPAHSLTRSLTHPPAHLHTRSLTHTHTHTPTD